MKIVFSTSNSLYALLIKLVTKGKYTHCGIVVGNEVYEAKPFHGVVKSEYDPLDWACSVKIKIEEEQLNKIKKFLDSELGCGYDWFGVCRFLFKPLKSNKNKWFCSELVVESLKKIKFFKKRIHSFNYSPQSLYSFLLKKT